MEIKLIVPDCTEVVSTTIIYDEGLCFRIKTKNFIPKDGKTVEVNKGVYEEETNG